MRAYVPVTTHHSSLVLPLLPRHPLFRVAPALLSLALVFSWPAWGAAQTAIPGASTTATTAADAPADGNYRSAALRRLVADAAAKNRLPRALESYSANVETEITLVIRRADGTEAVGSVEQVASTLRWTRTGMYDQRVQGHRMQQLGANISMLSVFRVGWLNPTLYGNRMRARQDGNTADSAGGDRIGNPGGASGNDASNDTVVVVHPLADDRDRWYTLPRRRHAGHAAGGRPPHPDRARAGGAA